MNEYTWVEVFESMNLYFKTPQDQETAMFWFEIGFKSALDNAVTD